MNVPDLTELKIRQVNTGSSHLPPHTLTSTSSHNPAPFNPNGVGDVASPGKIKLSIPSPRLVAMLLHARPEETAYSLHSRCARTVPVTPSLPNSVGYYCGSKPRSPEIPLRPRVKVCNRPVSSNRSLPLLFRSVALALW